jgi:hypothetical protein
MSGAIDVGGAVTIRKAPWPYRAMLAICSDLDETPDARVYLEIARFLNTTEVTAMGPGVGLEVGNTIYFDMPLGQFSYWGTDDAGRDMALALMRSGHIDAIHSWGDLATGRRHAERNLAELSGRGCRLEVWIDHSKAPSNFGPDIMRGSGDLSGSAAYHADLTLAYGVRYVWRGRTSGVTGQDVPVRPGSFAPILRTSHLAASLKSVAKEMAKVALGRLGQPRWRMYGDNVLCRPSVLRDGQAIWEFLRSNPSWGGPGASATASGVSDVLTSRMLDRLIRSGSACILYTHLGKIRDPTRPLDVPTEACLRRLAQLREDGILFVTTTRRLLRYWTVRKSLRFCARTTANGIVLDLGAVEDPITGPRFPTMDDLQGLTFEIEGRHDVEVRLVDGTPVAHRTVGNGSKTYALVPWRSLSFPMPGSLSTG